MVREVVLGYRRNLEANVKPLVEIVRAGNDVTINSAPVVIHDQTSEKKLIDILNRVRDMSMSLEEVVEYFSGSRESIVLISKIE